jgi:hypothetical protein
MIFSWFRVFSGFSICFLKKFGVVSWTWDFFCFFRWPAREFQVLVGF